MASAQEIVCSAAQKMPERTQGALQTSMEAAFQTPMKIIPERNPEECHAIYDDFMKFIAKHKLHGSSQQPASKKSKVMPPNKNVEKKSRYGVRKDKRAHAAFKHAPTLLQQEAILQQLMSGEESLFINSGSVHDHFSMSSRRK